MPRKRWGGQVGLIVLLLLLPAWSGVVWAQEPASGATGVTSSVTASVAAPVVAAAPASWTAVVPFDRHLFPSLIIVSEHPGFSRWPERLPGDLPVKGREHGWLSVEVQAARDHCPFRLVVSSRNLMEESVLEGVLENRALRYRLNPQIIWKFDSLNALRQSTLENLTFELSLDGRPVGKQVVTVQVRNINDCPMYFADEVTELDTSWMMAAYVNEDHPWIDGILKEALETGAVEQFDGYQQEDPDAVYLQVFAIWYVLQRKGMKYSSIHPTAAESEAISNQYVRFLDEAVENTQANCVDGSVLFASILRKIGLHPYLVSTPEHVFLAFDLSAEGDEVAFLETTQLGGLDLKTSGALDSAKKKLKGKKAEDDSWDSFCAASDEGEETFKKLRKRFALRDPDYVMIDVAAARKSGIMPIPYRK